MATRTIYVEVQNRKTGKALGVAACKTLAAEVGALNPRAWDRYRGDYIAGGTRFLSAEPDPETGTYRASPVVKIRGGDVLNNYALGEIAKRARVAAVWGHDRKLIGGKR